MARNIQPVELGVNEQALVSKLKAMALKRMGLKISVSKILRRSLQIAGPRILEGREPLIVEVTLKE